MTRYGAMSGLPPKDGLSILSTLEICKLASDAVFFFKALLNELANDAPDGCLGDGTGSAGNESPLLLLPFAYAAPFPFTCATLGDADGEMGSGVGIPSVSVWKDKKNRLERAMI